MVSFGDGLTALSIGFAVFAFWLGYMQRIRFERQQNTIELLSLIFREGPVSEAHTEIVRWIASNKTLADDKVSKEEEEVIVPILEFYVFLSDAALRGTIDKKQVLIHRGGGMRAAYEILKPYIEHRKKTLDRRDVFLPFERFVANVVKNKKL